VSTSLGERLKACRLERGISQTELSTIGGVKKGTQINYESDKRKPDSDYLFRLWLAGFDTQYLLTGLRFVLPDMPERGSGYSDEGWAIFTNGWAAYAKAMHRSGLQGACPKEIA
jgi:transcriptional regulator with XRE-family HTH domain